ncbi:MAG TPA: hypothetical protein VNO70_12450, partial [Blastocatellia bacterium]|nr:hypothetical protein [Blastocatellia bacterium]
IRRGHFCCGGALQPAAALGFGVRLGSRRGTKMIANLRFEISKFLTQRHGGIADLRLEIAKIFRLRSKERNGPLEQRGCKKSVTRYKRRRRVERTLQSIVVNITDTLQAFGWHLEFGERI